MTTIVALLLAAVIASATADNAMVTKKCTFTVVIGDQEIGKIVIGLFEQVVPKTAGNFATLCAAASGHGYQSSIFHRVIKDFMIQGGDYSNKDGTGEESSYGGLFEDENFILRHSAAGWVSMANRGRDTNGSQFFISLVPTPWLDGKHTVFGKVLEGMEVVMDIGNTPTDDKDKPVSDVTVVEASLEEVAEPFEVLLDGPDGPPQ